MYIKKRAESIVEMDIPATVYCDNKAAKIVAKGEGGYSSRGARHIDIRYHLVRDLVESQQISIDRVNTKITREIHSLNP